MAASRCAYLKRKHRKLLQNYSLIYKWMTSLWRTRRSMTSLTRSFLKRRKCETLHRLLPVLDEDIDSPAVSISCCELLLHDWDDRRAGHLSCSLVHDCESAGRECWWIYPR